ncbi:MAG: hypothetical protein ACLPWD_00365 [Methanobacterium sp.]
MNPSNQTLGYTHYGNAVKIGPQGNINSPVKIAIIVGVHPLEYHAHNMAINFIENNSKNLKYCYYIYKVNVTKDIFEFETGRMNGQLLANKFIVPDIINNNYMLTLDIHTNYGANDGYSVGWFLNVPINDNESLELLNQVINKVPGLELYDPPYPTSPMYITIPIIENGTPAIIYESYGYDTLETQKKRLNKFLSVVDNLNLS